MQQKLTLISSFCFAHLRHSDEKSACTSGKKFIKITGIGMGVAKRNKRGHLESGPCMPTSYYV